jgi:hypothetical protein
MELIIDKNGKAVDIEDVSVTIIFESKEEADRVKEAMTEGRVQQMEWHPIEIRDGEIDGELPEDGQVVLVSTIYDGVIVDVFCADEDGGFFEDWDWPQVKAWAEMPEPYKPREEGTT